MSRDYCLYEFTPGIALHGAGRPLLMLLVALI